MSLSFSWPQKKRRRVSFETTPSLEFPLPLPTVHRPTTPRKVQFGTVAVRSKWAALRSYLHRTLSTPSPPNSFDELSIDAISLPAKDLPSLVSSDTDEIDEVVVDRSWAEEFEMDKSSVAETQASSRAHDASVADSDAFVPRPTGLVLVATQVWAILVRFYRPRFEDTAQESAYQKEVWSQAKRPSLWASVFFLANCLVSALTIEEPIVLADKVFYYGISPLLSVPMIFMCAYNFPYDHPFVFQTFVLASSWSWPFYEIFYAYSCGFYRRKHDLFTCGSKDFLSTFYYTSALQVVALFGVSLKRLPATIGAIAFLVLICVTIVTQQHTYVRNVINFIIFESVLLYMHNEKEQSARKLFMLRTQLKQQFEHTFKAQVNERQAADSKRRLTSYVFHEVRVPLNTALLAVQNMASRPIAQDHELEFSALEGSLSMMSKVLNDVLDFNRMDSGRLESLSKPYAFHKVLRSTFIPLRLAADARHLEFETDLDMRIDDIARRAAYQAMDAAPEVITQHLHQTPSSETAVGVVVGDETRLRQIITNLASNACKFTPAGGKLTIRTRLVIPAAPCTMLPPVPVPPPLVSKEGSSELTETALTLHNESVPPDPKVSSPFAPLERIVVRIEIIDTGSGIPPKDMVQCKLFSAFNQTEQGRQQGGKGTGLGLALVRQIVKLSGGRLGLKSKVGVGSTFWVEIPLGVGRKAMEPSPGTPSSQAHPQTQFPFTGHNLNPGSIGSVASVAEAVDAATKAASQPHPQQTRSESALHGLMDQGGRFELMLSKYDSHSPMPTRTLGDTSTGTEYPLSTPEIETQPLPEVVPVPPPLEDGGSGGETLKPRQPRPTYVPLPPPFTVEAALEVALSPGQASNASSISASQTVPVGLYVLVVDDDAMTRTLMTRMLERLGCRVSSAENGEVALHKILGEDTSPAQSRASAEPPPPVAPGEPRYAVVFLDNQMPKLSGVKVVERLRAMKRTDFVVGVTGNALLTDQKEYLDAGADHVLTKPVLEASLRKMLGLADARRRGVGC